MFPKNRYEITFVALLALLSLFIITCGGAPAVPAACPSGNAIRTQNCDEFKVWSNVVNKNSQQFANAGWWPLVTNDSLSTDNNGEAELNFSSCYPQALYIFKDTNSVFRAATCGKQAFGGGNNQCLEYGATYNSCPGEITVYTSNAKIVKKGTAYGVVYLPERDLTLVVVLDGNVFLLPVINYEPTEYGNAIDVQGGNFAFITPSGPVGGLDAGISYPLTELPRIVPELNIQDWMSKVREKAELDKVLPPAWPENLEVPGSSYKIDFQGGLLTDPLIQQALLYSVDWRAIFQPLSDFTLFANVDNQTVDVLQTFSFNPEIANANLEKTGHPGGGFEIILIYPEGDPQLSGSAYLIAESIQARGVKVLVTPVPFADLNAIVATRAAAGESIMSITP